MVALTSNAGEYSLSAREEFLNDLCPRIRPVVAHLMECDCGCAVLDFFRQRPLTWLQASDVAYHLRQPHQVIAETLNQIAEAGLVERRNILNSTFYGLTKNENLLNALEQFWVWRDDWRSRVESVRVALQLQA